MEKSVFGCAFLLYHGGFLWHLVILAMQSRRDSSWKPLSGSEGLRPGGEQKKGVGFWCPIVFDIGSETVPFSVLEKTIPGRLMIWQAEHPDSRYTFREKCSIGLRLLASATYGAINGLSRFHISALVSILRTILLVYTLGDNFVEKLFCNKSERFEHLP